MKNVFIEIVNRLITSLVLMIIIFLASYCLVTGEFPPKWKNLKAGVFQLQDQLKTIKKIQEQKLNALAKASQQTSNEAIEPALNNKRAQIIAQENGSTNQPNQQTANSMNHEIQQRFTELFLRYNELRDAHNTLMVQFQVLQIQVQKLEMKIQKK
jgi:translation initiation factor IF-2